MEEKTGCPGGADRYRWSGLTLPVLPSLRYQADGPDKEKPDRLFIADRQERFLFYFEDGYDGLSQLREGDPNYDTVEVLHRGVRLRLCYPVQQPETGVTTGFFRIERLEPAEVLCTGSLSISPPEPYCEGLHSFPGIRALFTGLMACGREYNTGKEEEP